MSAFILALVVVLLLNPIYGRTQKVVDRVFFRERRDIQRSLESLSDRMTTMHDLDGIGTLILTAIDDFFPPRAPGTSSCSIPNEGFLPGIVADEALRRADPARRLRARPLLGEGRAFLHAGAASRRARYLAAPTPAR